jgi:glucose-1-phosphate adenylyltransferase
MDLLSEDPPLDLNDRSWVIHTRTEERPPARLARGAKVGDSLIADGCVIAPDAEVIRSVLGPGVRVERGARVVDSVILTDAVVRAGAVVERAIFDKRVHVGENAQVGQCGSDRPLTMIGKTSVIPADARIDPGVVVSADVIESDYPSLHVKTGQIIEKTRRLRHDL